MGLADEMRADVDRRLDRLRETYGGFPVEDVTVGNDPGSSRRAAASPSATGAGTPGRG